MILEPPFSPEWTIYAYMAGSTHFWIGCSRSLGSRHRYHRIHSPWWSSTLDLEVLSTHRNHGAALRAERAAIREFTPQFNVQSNPVNGFISTRWRTAA